MRLTIWDHPAAAFLMTGLDASPYAATTELRSVPAQSAIDELLTGRTDVALVHTLEALEHADEVDVLPAVALSAWKYPFARLILRKGLAEPSAIIARADGFDQENTLARIILKEHYGMTPEFVSVDDDDASIDRIVVSTDLEGTSDSLVLDLGQEWSELTGYPMIWGVFATRKGEVDDGLIHHIRGIVQTSEDRMSLWLSSQDLTPAMHDFYSEQMRLHLDDLAIAGLTELRQFLFYYGVFDEVRELPVVFLTQNEDGEEDDVI